MASPLNIKNQRGFTLIEALFSAIVLGIGLLALAGFHAVALQDGTLVKMRMVATSLAQEKLDDLKSFSLLKDDPDTAANECAAGTFCYTEIAADTGGQEDGAGSLLLPATTATVSGTAYTRAWTVACYSETAGGAPVVDAACTDADFKLVTVTIKWTDNKGVDQTTSLQGAIYGVDPSDVTRTAANPAASPGPKVKYTPVGVPDAVPVPISSGGDKFKESSKPLPEVSQSGRGIEVSFDSVIYSGKTGSYTKDSQEEFATVTCECQFNSGTAKAYTPTRKVWNGSTLETKVGEEVEKVTGVRGTGQPDKCDVCCRDHHDLNSDAYPKYDPQRPSGDYTTDDHKHYWYSKCVSGGVGSTSGCNDAAKNTSLSSATPFAAVTSGAYLESCRLMRVDGFWRVMQDWQLRKVTVLPYSYLQTDANLDSYVNMVEEVVEDAVRKDYTGTGISITPLSGRDLNLSSGDAPVQLLSRAVYVDTIYGAEDDPATADNELHLPDSAYYKALLDKIDASHSASNKAWLEFAPFYEANLTLLYDWTSGNTGIATVTSEAIEAIVDPVNGYYGSFSRGKVTIQSGSTAGEATITAKARLANSGVTGGVNRTGASYVPGVSFGTDEHDNLGANTLSDSIIVKRLAGGTAHTIKGKVLKGNSSVNVSETGSPASPITVTANTTSGSVINACVAQTGDPDNNAWYYTCTVSDGWTGTLTFDSTGDVYTFNDATTTELTIPSSSVITVNASYSVADVVAYGGQVTITGFVYKENNPTGNPQPDIAPNKTTITFGGSSSGTCTNKVLEGSGANEKLRYSCVVPKGWTGNITVEVDAAGGAYTYRSPEGSPCTGSSTSSSCTMLEITSALADIDGTSGSASLTQKQQTNVTARR